MKKLSFLVLFLIPGIAHADRLGSIKSSADVPLSSQTIRNQATLQSGATFYVSSGSVAGQFRVTDSSNPRNLTIYPDPGFGLGGFVHFVQAYAASGSGGSVGPYRIVVSSESSLPALTSNDQSTLLFYPPGNASNPTGAIAFGFGNNVALKMTPTGTTISGLIYPTSDGSTGQFIKTDGSGNLSFGTASGGGASTLAVGTGTASNFTNNITSPTAAISFLGTQFKSVANGTTNFVSLANVVTAGSYGSATVSPTITFNDQGQIIGASSNTIVGGSGGGYNVEPATVTFQLNQGVTATTGTFSGLLALSSAATAVPMTVKGASSQSSNLQEWKNSSNNILAKIRSDGRFQILDTAGNNYYSTTNGRGITLGDAALSSAYWHEIVNAQGYSLWGLATVPGNITPDALPGDTVIGPSSTGRVLFGETLAGVTPAWVIFSAATQNALINISGQNVVGLAIRGAASQSADLQEWRNSSSVALASVTASGVFTGDGSGLVRVSSLTAVVAAGSYGSATVSPTIIFNAQGQIIGASSNTITGTGGAPQDFDLADTTGSFTNGVTASSLFVSGSTISVNGLQYTGWPSTVGLAATSSGVFVVNGSSQVSIQPAITDAAQKDHYSAITATMNFVAGSTVQVLGSMLDNSLTAGTSGYAWTTRGPSLSPQWLPQSGGGGTPAGGNQQIQFDNSGSFGGVAVATYNATTQLLTFSSAVTHVNVSSETFNNVRLVMSGTSAIQWADGTVQTSSPTAGSGSGSSSLAVTTGSTTGFVVVTASPTAVINFSSDTFNASLKGSATAFITLNPSSVTLQGNTLNAASSLLQLTASGVVGAGQVPTFAGDVTTPGGSLTTTIASHAVSNAKFRQGAALSVVGVTGSVTADEADIAGIANQVLRVDGAGNALAFGAIDLSQSAAVTGSLPAASIAAGSLGNTVQVSSLAAVVTAGSYGSATISPTITFNAQGQIIAASSNTIVGGAAQDFDLADSTGSFNRDISFSTAALTNISSITFVTSRANYTMFWSTVAYITTSTSTTLTASTVAATGLSFPMAPNEVVKIHIFLTVSDSTTNGIKLALQGPSGATAVPLFWKGTSSASTSIRTETNGLNAIGGTFLTFSGTGFVECDGIVTNSSTGGTLQLGFESGAAGTATIAAGSYIDARRVK